MTTRTPRTIRKSTARHRTLFEALEGRSMLSVSLSPVVYYGTGADPRSVAVGDLNGDGKSDLVTANYGSNNVSVLLGNGDGTFRNATSYGDMLGPIHVAVADFNNDGKLDVVSANDLAESVSVMLGNGNGTLQAQQNYAIGSPTFSVTTGDFNGDGRQDLAACSYLGWKVQILLGNGNGTFQILGNHSVGAGPRSVAVGDFNGDGKRDLVTANEYDGTVSVLLGNGNGTFQPAANFSTANVPWDVAVADLNGDGKQDLVTAALQQRYWVLMGNGNGTFQPAVWYQVTGGAPAVAIADLSMDGRPDVVAAGGFGNKTVVREGNGDGTFGPALGYDTAAFPTDVAVSDFNNDGRRDVVTANRDSNNVGVLLNTTIINTPPTIASDQPAVVFNEGEMPINTGTFADAQGNGTVTLTASTGVVDRNDAAGTWTWRTGWRDDTTAPIPVTITATDVLGATATTTFTLSVNNLSPRITAISLPTTGSEGTPITLSASGADPAGALDPLNFVWTVSRTGTSPLTLTGANVTFTPPDNDSYRISLTVDDGDGGLAIAPIPSGLVAWYHAEGTAIDQSILHPGTLVGGTNFAPGRVGAAFNFDGIDDHVRLPDNLVPYPTAGTSTAPLSFQTWFRTSAPGGVIMSQQGTAGYVPALYVGTDGRLRAQMFYGGSANPISSANPVNNNQWHHVAVTHNGATQNVFLDGVAIGTRTFAQTAYGTSYEYRLGTGRVAGWPATPPTLPAGDTWNFKGQIDETMFLSRALSPSDVQAAFSGGIAAEPRPVTVTNVAPLPIFDGPSTGRPAQALTYTLRASDPSAVDQAAGFEYRIDWGDGSPIQVIPRAAGNGSGASVTHAYAAVGTYNAKLTAIDKDGGARTTPPRTIAIALANTNPRYAIPTKGSPPATTDAHGGGGGAAHDLFTGLDDDTPDELAL